MKNAFIDKISSTWWGNTLSISCFQECIFDSLPNDRLTEFTNFFYYKCSFLSRYSKWWKQGKSKSYSFILSNGVSWMKRGDSSFQCCIRDGCRPFSFPAMPPQKAMSSQERSAYEAQKLIISHNFNHARSLRPCWCCHLNSLVTRP